MPRWLARLILALFLSSRGIFTLGIIVLLVVAACYLRIHELWWVPPENR